MHWSPDSEGINGIFLGKEIIDEAAKVIEDVMRAITPRVGCALCVVLWVGCCSAALGAVDGPLAPQARFMA